VKIAIAGAGGRIARTLRAQVLDDTAMEVEGGLDAAG
jgi:dihydrodipicolinate reductase